MASDYRRITRENVLKRGTDFDDIGRFLAEQLYSDRTHFVYELLQNAEDAIGRRAKRSQNGFRRSVEFRLFRDRLELRHFGEPFDEADVRGICDVLRGTKSDDVTQIGRFGIGFKSVYAYTSSPKIYSGDEHFRIERYIRPRSVPARRLREEETLFVFPFDHEAVPADEAFEQIQERLRSLGPRTLLFLRNAEEIAWTSEGTAGGVYRRQDKRQDEIRRSTVVGKHHAGSVVAEEWLVFERQAVEPETGNVARVEAAFRVVEDEVTGRKVIVPVEDSELVVFFPTEKPTNLGFLIQGPYKTTPARDNIVFPDPWNRRIIEETATLVAQLLPKIRDMGMLTASFLEVLPIHSSYFTPWSAFHPIFDRVREVLTKHNLLPTPSGHFVSAADAKLARGAALRELLSDDQLKALYRSGRPVRWLAADITYDRTPGLRRYLLDELDIEEVVADGFARRLDTDFLEEQTDAWMIRLYRFLDEQKALWRATTTWRQGAAPIRNKPFIRLEDSSHVAPFRLQTGEPQAFLPLEMPTDLPTVKKEIAADEQALEFLKHLGLSEPDIVDEVIGKTLPKYRGLESREIDDQEHEGDIRKIFLALGTDSESKVRRLIKSLSNTPFLFAQNVKTGRIALQTPPSVYMRSPELEIYFEDNPSVWFLDERYAQHEQRLRNLGVSATVRVSCNAPMKYGLHEGHVVLADQRGWHERGRNGFDPECEIDGLEHALQHPTFEKARYVWNSLLGTNFRHVRGVVETSTRKSYEGSTSEERLSEMGALATNCAWLPDEQGEFKKPENLALSDLPEGFARNEMLATALRMRASEEVALASKLGFDPEDLDFLRRNKKEFEQWKEQIKKKQLQDTTQRKKGTEEEGQSQDIDFRKELVTAFEKDGSSNPVEDMPSPGPVGLPERRRQRTQEQIREARRDEPEPEQRFSQVLRKIWEGKDQQVRTFLLQQYQGKCQICTHTFPKRNGEPYFEGLYLVSSTHAKWVGRSGNVLCLCANCCAKFQYGAVEANNILEQVESFRARNENGDGKPVLRIKLNGESAEIKFTEQHMIGLQEMVKTRPGEQSASNRAGEEQSVYEREVRISAGDPDGKQAEELTGEILENAGPSQLPPEHQGDATGPAVSEEVNLASDASQAQSPGDSKGALLGSPMTLVPNTREAVLALNACLPDGERVARDTLLRDAARELGHPKLTKKVRSALNQALNAEHNAGRLKTDWRWVWKPRKK